MDNVAQIEMQVSKPENLIKIHVMLDRADHDRFREIWGPDALLPENRIGVSKAIRIAMRRLLIDHEARTRRIIDSSASPHNEGE